MWKSNDSTLSPSQMTELSNQSLKKSPDIWKEAHFRSYLGRNINWSVNRKACFHTQLQRLQFCRHRTYWHVLCWEPWPRTSSQWFHTQLQTAPLQAGGHRSMNPVKHNWCVTCTCLLNGITKIFISNHTYHHSGLTDLSFSSSETLLTTYTVSHTHIEADKHTHIALHSLIVL